MLSLTIFGVLIACAAAIEGSDFNKAGLDRQQPYNFGYMIKSKEGQQYREESSDGSGSVKGKYGYVDEKGILRQVSYVADKNGYRAQVQTNEPGVSQQNPASAKFISNTQYSQGMQVPYLARPYNGPSAYGSSYNKRFGLLDD